eukprot:gene2889-4732_t
MRRSISPKRKTIQTKSNINEKNLLTLFKNYLVKKKKFQHFQEFVEPKTETIDVSLYRKFYQTITSEEAYKSFCKTINEMFKPITTAREETGDNEKDLKSPKTPKNISFLGEDMFFLVLEIVTKWKEYKILDTFDFLSGKVGFVEVDVLYFIICLLVAIEAKLGLEFLFQFGDSVYDGIISRTGHRNFGYIADVNDLFISKCCKQLGISLTKTDLTKDEFLKLYFLIFKLNDQN